MEKARAIYEWVVENTFRDPQTRGCGVVREDDAGSGGKGRQMRRYQYAVRALCRSAGVPAGMSTACEWRNRPRYQESGKGGNITKAQHVRGFYAVGRGLVPLIRLIVRKVVLEEERADFRKLYRTPW